MVATSVEVSEKKVSEKKVLLRLHHLRPAPGAKRSRVRVGRGEGSKGKTAGRGTKGTKARSSVKLGFEGGQMPLHMRTPKLKGFKNPARVQYQLISIKRLCEVFPQGGTLGREDLRFLVRKKGPIKLLADGQPQAKFDLTVDKASVSAVEKIVAAGGTVNQVKV